MVKKKNFEKHQKSHKTNVGPKICPHCPETFAETSELYKHLDQHTEGGSVPCSICKKSINKYSLPVHLKTHKNSQSYQCDICLKTVNTKRSFLRHMATIHERSTQVCCEICGLQMCDSTSYRKHLVKHAENKEVQCEICNKSVQKSQLSHHLRLHGAKMYTCDLCKQTFNLKNHLIKHVKEVHEKSETSTCDICKKVYSNEKTLKTHLRLHSLKDQVPCTVCGKLMARHLIKQHTKIHGDKSYRCVVCGKSFAQLAGLNQHQLVHGDRSIKIQNTVECDICSRVLSSKISLYLHKRGVHGIGGLSCEVCGKTCACKSALISHMKTHDNKGGL